MTKLDDVLVERRFVGRALAVLAVLGLGIRLWVSRLDVYLLFQKCIVDDAFFYFNIARHIAEGRGATFDGSIMTNGFHPIYALLLVPVFLLSPSLGDGPVRYALSVLSLFNVATGMLIYLAVRELAGRLAGLVASFIWLFNPYVIMISLSGVEVAVSAFFSCLSIYLYIRMRRKGSFCLRSLIVLGVSVALAVLSRVDAVFLFGAMGLDLLWGALRRRQGLWSVFWRPLVFGTTVVAVLAPWLAWNVYRFGTIRQISGVTLPQIAHTMYLERHQTYLSMALVKTELFYLKLWSLNILRFGGGVGLFVLLAALLLWVWWKKPGFGPASLRRGLGEIGFALVSAVALVMFYALYFWGWLRPWYYLSVIVVLTIAVGIIVGHLLDGLCWAGASPRASRGGVKASLAVLALYFSLYGAVAWGRGLFAFQKQLYDSALWLDTETEKDARIAAISAGVYGYVTQRTLDLAGVVNEEAYGAMRDKRIFSYLLEKKIDYLVDREDMVRFYSSQFDRDGFMDHLEPVKRFGERLSDVVVYRIRPSEKGR